jgi:hypothetical protein
LMEDAFAVIGADGGFSQLALVVEWAVSEK